MKKSLVILFILVNALEIKSQDRLFTYTYQSGVLNKGQKEIEIWNTFHWGRDDYYRAFRHRIEYEVGLGKNVQTAFYLNITSASSQVARPVTLGNVTIAEAALVSSTGISFSNEWKIKLSDPVANTIGSGLYGEIGIAADELELEAKILLDKKIGRTLSALNIVGEIEFESEVENGEVEQEAEYAFEFDYGFSYNINNNWNVGFEVRNHNAVTEEDGWKYSALFGGPGFSYVSERFWLNFTAMPQIAGLYHHNNSGLIDGKVLDDHEKLETRMIFSYVF